MYNKERALSSGTLLYFVPIRFSRTELFNNLPVRNRSRFHVEVEAHANDG